MSERQIIKPEVGVPVMVTLDWDTPLPSDGQFGPQWRYVVNDDSAIMYLPEAAKLAIDRSGAKQGDTLSLTKTKNGNRNVWTAELAKSDAPRTQPETGASKAAARPSSPAAETEVERARRLLAEAEAKEAAAQKQQEEKRATETPIQSYPLMEQLLPFLRGAILACQKAEDEAKQNGIEIKFSSADVQKFATTLFLNAKGGR